MAPRVRRRKVGLKRMDAALDALCQLGFSRVLIRDTVRSLLQVYGGDSGWVFIEEDSYKVVIDKILENDEKCLSEKDEAQEADAIPTTSIQTASEMETNDPQTTAEMETGDPHTAAEREKDLPLAEGGASGRKIFGKIQSLPPTGDLHCKRKPCYGWISSDDDEDIVILRTNDSLRRRPINSARRRKTRWDVKPEDQESFCW
ncbi:hypothetical protein NE237_010011 [Protea cynaroides]|uniref:WIYLD domain-containing protein n=1 Tax=Protea cynaroides TaxID=273540 RepID=A0A9Q0KZE7_9MAGN|nr:hypothetical protein NE237_010011 [Protea cynaroides]